LETSCLEGHETDEGRRNGFGNGLFFLGRGTSAKDDPSMAFDNRQDR
jgi:hypothetical protein